MKSILEAEKVHRLFLECLAPKDTPKEASLLTGQGCGGEYKFYGDALVQKFETIKVMLKELPREFMKSSGSLGCSFLNACITKDGNQWGEHINIEELISMGSALRLVTFPFPRNTWKSLPGGMPYFEIDDEKVEIV